MYFHRDEHAQLKCHEKVYLMYLTSLTIYLNIQYEKQL